MAGEEGDQRLLPAFRSWPSLHMEALVSGLSSTQEQLIPTIRDRWISIGRSTEPALREVAERGVALVFRALGLEPPRVVWLRSPIAGALAATMLGAADGGQGDRLPGLARSLADQRGSRLRASLRTSVRTAENSREISQVLRRIEPLEAPGSRLYNRLCQDLTNSVDDQIGYGIAHPIQYGLTALTWEGEGAAGRPKRTTWDERGPLAWQELGDSLSPTFCSSKDWADLGAAILEDMFHPEPSARDQLKNTLSWNLVHTGAGQYAADALALPAFLLESGIPHGGRLTGLFERLRGLFQLAQSCGHWWAFERLVILTERPCLLALEDPPRGKAVMGKAAVARIHSEDGPAVEYPDGFSIHAWHGVPVPQHVITSPGSITVEAIEATEDRQAKRILIERFGQERYRQEMDARRSHRPQSQIEVDPAVFAEDEDGCSNEHVLVTGADPRLAALALKRAAQRFMNVTATGVEIGSDAEYSIRELPYTPNSVSEVRHVDRGPWLEVDCKSEIPPAMRTAFIAILKEEIENAGILVARLESPPLDELYRGTA